MLSILSGEICSISIVPLDVAVILPLPYVEAI